MTVEDQKIDIKYYDVILMNYVEIQSPIHFKTDEKAKAFGPELVISVSVSHLLITINASANFAIYCAKVSTYNLTHAYCKIPNKHE